ncbi:MAG: hypothetical protein A6F70_05235 [Cycloclasticus sp. symbiont of Bathymodiolus heckerae]|nr:MAG: hypothetical protein A6F70_05235 [Cycloclasticus sp. symbiont of Bathymodiolus heckerae]
MKKILFLLLLLLFVSSIIHAGALEGKKKIYLMSSGGELTHFANVEFTPNDDNIEYKVSLVDKPFEDQFLSMRPFKCIMGTKQVMCHVPYPYEKNGFITESNLTSLSYDLLFLHKSPSEYGINMWNGILYQLKEVGNEIRGVVSEIDMNVIASPPDDLNEPFLEDEIFEADLVNYVYPRVLIKE